MLTEPITVSHLIRWHETLKEKLGPMYTCNSNMNIEMISNLARIVLARGVSFETRALKAAALPVVSTNFEHSCDPNTAIKSISFASNKTSIEFDAIQDIKQDEVLTINCVDFSLPHRKKVLKERYGYDCSCRRCLLSEKET